MGPVPLRARLGHRPRGLQRRRRRLGVLPARPRAEPRLPVERGRARRSLRSQPGALPRPRLVERGGRHPQGARVRPHRPRGQPRRGREGGLLLRGRDADLQLPALGLQVSAAALPVRRAGGAEPRPRRRRARGRARRPRRVRRGSLLRRHGRVRQARALRHPHGHHGGEPRPGGRAAAPLAAPLVPQHLGLVRRARRHARDPRGAWKRRPRPHRARRGALARRALLLRRGRRRAALHAQRQQRRAPVGLAVADPLRQGRLPRAGRPRRPIARLPRRARHQDGRVAPLRGPGGRPGPPPRAALARGRRAIPSTAATRCSASAGTRPTPTTPRCRAPGSPTIVAPSTARRRRGSCGASSSTTSTSTSGSRATRRRRRRKPASAAATGTGAMSRWPTSSPCQTSGSTPGSPPGISPSTRWRWPPSTSIRPRPSSS